MSNRLPILSSTDSNNHNADAVHAQGIVVSVSGASFNSSFFHGGTNLLACGASDTDIHTIPRSHRAKPLRSETAPIHR